MPAVRPIDDEYARLVEPYRSELQAHCCRMLRSSDDAEDALQEALLRAWRGLPAFEGRSSVRAWLYRISTNACLDTIERRRKRVLPMDGGSPFDLDEGAIEALAEPVDERPTPDAAFEQRERLELALRVAYDHLSPRTRTVLVLRLALGLSAREVAAKLDTSVASVNSALQRARATLDQGVLEPSREPSSHPIRLCADAIDSGDADSLIRLLTNQK